MLFVQVIDLFGIKVKALVVKILYFYSYKKYLFFFFILPFSLKELNDLEDYMDSSIH